MDKRSKSVSVKKVDAEDGAEMKTFTFDFIYPPDSKQIDVFNECAKPIVDDVVNGFNGTIFAYGQTGTGKTFSMEGVPDNPDLRGIMPNTFHHVIHSMENRGENTEYMVRMSFIEIYNEGVFDLLNKAQRKPMEVKESKEKGIFIKDLTTFTVKNVPDMMKILAIGQGSRKVGATAMNAGSSRSHSILSITIETSYLMEGSDEPKYKVGKMNLVDLAGSERQKRTGASGDRLDEAKSINLSLSALGNVIKALVNPNSKHIPFRDSKLTRLLQDSLGGNTKTCMLAAMSPGALSYDESMSTLRYANRAKNIKNKPKINEDPKDTKLREAQEYIALLKAQLAAKAAGKPIPTGPVPAGMGPGAPGAAMGEGGDPQKIIQENIIEQVEVVDTGISEADMQELQKRLEAEAAALEGKTETEKRAYVQEKTKLEQEAKRKADELARKEAKAKAEQDKVSQIKAQLEEVEGSIGRGQLDLERAEEQQRKVDEVNERLLKQQEEELNTLQQLEQAEEEELLMEEHYENAKDELKIKSKKLKKLWIKFNEKKEDMEDMHEEFNLEREDLVDTIRALDRQIKLKHLMVDAFVPPAYVDLIEQSAIWDSVNDRWVIGGLAYAANNIQRQEVREGFDMQYDGQPDMHGNQFDMNQTDMEARYTRAMNNHAMQPQKEVFFSYGPDMLKKKKKNKH